MLPALFARQGSWKKGFPTEKGPLLRSGFIHQVSASMVWTKTPAPWETKLFRAVGMTTSSVVSQKGLPKDYFLHIKGDSLVSQKWGATP